VTLLLRLRVAGSGVPSGRVQFLHRPSCLCRRHRGEQRPGQTSIVLAKHFPNILGLLLSLVLARQVVQMSAAVAVIRRLWTRDTSKQRKSSDASTTLESPSTPASTDQTFAGSGSDSHRRGENPESDYSGSSAATGRGKLSRALSQRFRGRPSRRPSEGSTSEAVSIESGKQQKPTVCHTFCYTA
jgi:hypothetical protein